ncbi:MAG: glycosyltransferase family 2 protein [Bacteroidota bacterium]
MTRTAVVILNFNGEKLLPQFLPSVIQHSTNAEIIVADNGSTDQSVSLLKKQFPQVRLIELNKNFGFCGGYNRALQQVQAEYYVLLNSDVEVTSRWLEPLTSILDKDLSIAAIQPKILSYQNKNKFEYAGAGGGFIDTLGYPFCRGRIFDHVDEDRGQYNDEREVFWATGACLMIRSSAYHRFNGLDEDLFAHMEEIDLCWKLNRAGQKVYYSGKSTVYHLGAGTLGYQSPRKTYLNFRNALTLIFKHFDTAELLYKFPLRIALDWVAGFVFLIKGQFGNFGSIGKAHLHFILRLNSHYKKRRAIRKAYPSYSRRAIYRGMVIIAYYLKKERGNLMDQ